jgi:cytochrome oxidase Cu insertion factor (SCO1/SenC/PrrC family)
LGLWFLAFYPLGVDSKWLMTAQSVCFGTLDNGMPDSYGWIKLISTPMILLFVFFAISRKELLRIKKDIFSSLKGKIFIVFLIIVFFLQAAFVAKRVLYAKEISLIFSPSNFGTHNISLPKSYPQTLIEAPFFELIDQNGKRFGINDTKGRVTYLTFAFTKCTSICPLLINTVRTALKKSSDSNRLLLIVSLDPWRETINNVAHVTRNLKLGENEHYLVGKLKEVEKVLDNYNVSRIRDKKDGEIAHPGLVYVLDTEGRIAYTFNSPSSRWLIDAGDRILNL